MTDQSNMSPASPASQKTISDYICSYDNTAGLTVQTGKDIGLSFPEAYFNPQDLVKMVLAQKEADGAPFCEITMGRCLEAEALGADIKLDDSSAGPMVNSYRCSKPEELANLPEIDLDHPRLMAVLEAGKLLSEMGENVMLEISGPFNILSFLIPTPKLFKGFRKTPEMMQSVLDKLRGDILAFMKKAAAYGVNIINYSDAVGGVNMLGPDLAARIVSMFTRSLVEEMREISDEKTMTVLCPKTTLALLGTGNAEFRDIPLDKPMRYGEAILAMRAPGRIGGSMCIKKLDYTSDRFKEIVLL